MNRLSTVCTVMTTIAFSFWHNRGTSDAERLHRSISHFVVLPNSDKDLFVLMPVCALLKRLHVDGTRLSVQVILDRRKQEWIDDIGEVRCYLDRA